MLSNCLRMAVIAIAVFAVSACDKEPAVVDTTLSDTKNPTTLEKAEIETATATATPGPSLHALTAEWLVGTWGPAEANPTNNPEGSCETDVIIRFAADGTFEDAGSKGRYSTDGRSIRYFDRETIPDLAADPAEPFYPESLEDWNGTVTVIDENTFEEEGELWRRCRSY